MLEQSKRTIEPIAYIRTDFKEKFGIPRQSGRVEGILGEIVFLPPYNDEKAFNGIEEFSHLWLLFDFSEVPPIDGVSWSPTVRPPRLGGNKRMGVFATRSPFRPNKIGLSSVRLVSVNKTSDNGITLTVSGADLLDMTPIYDIKPYLPMTDIRKEAFGSYSDEKWDHRLEVDIPEELLLLIPEDKREAVKECIADDPRPAYQNDPHRVYSMRFACLDIHFTVCENTAKVTGIDIL
ncbi:MAG: tRNA (N6-threonylcarbamoyladenosine(37)-N6)-methyltransferase TrmO [Ruminococcaceae bacterium]|nr:tRNA (N6-threonylcarbamoyladenosine(37)-N6)-methyltransferase TrmO [Oscillospiraceae bacterium]